MGRLIDILLLIGVILLILWLLGLIASYTLNGYVHIALIVGLILLAVWLAGRVIGWRR